MATKKPINRTRTAGFVAEFPVKDPAIGGSIVVWDSSKAKRSLPQKDYQHRWVILHHDGKAVSPKGISYRTKREAIEQGELLSSYLPNQILRKLDGKIRPRDTEEKKAGGTEISAAATPDPHPPSPSPLVAGEIVTQEQINELIINRLGSIGVDKVQAVVNEALEAEVTVWEDTGEVDDKGKALVRPVLKADHKTRLSAATLWFHYTVGRPLERQEVIQRRQFDYTDIDEQLRHSPLYRRKLREKLDEIDKQEREAANDERKIANEGEQK